MIMRCHQTQAINTKAEIVKEPNRNLESAKNNN